MILEVGKTYFIRTNDDFLYNDATILTADERFVKLQYVYKELLRIEIIRIDTIKDAKEMSDKDKIKIWHWRACDTTHPKMETEWLSQEEYKLNKSILVLYTNESEAKEKVFEAALEDPTRIYYFETNDGSQKELYQNSCHKWCGNLDMEFNEWEAQRKTKKD